MRVFYVPWTAPAETQIGSATTRTAPLKPLEKKIVWKESKTYKATKAKLADLYRRQAQTRRCLHGEVINQVFGRAGTVIVEKN